MLSWYRLFLVFIFTYLILAFIFSIPTYQISPNDTVFNVSKINALLLLPGDLRASVLNAVVVPFLNQNEFEQLSLFWGSITQLQECFLGLLIALNINSLLAFPVFVILEGVKRLINRYVRGFRSAQADLSR